MSNKTVIHIFKSLLTGLAYMLLLTKNPFPGEDPTIIISSLIVVIFIALAFQIIPLIIYFLSYLFTSNKDKAKNIFNRSFNILFWLWMAFMIIGGISSKYTEKKMEEYKRTGDVGMIEINNAKEVYL